MSARGILLVTGAAGFLGAQVCARARDEGWEVVGVWHARQPSGADRIIRADLAEPDAAERVVGEVTPDAVIHCAANARTNDCQRDPHSARRINADASARLAAACARRSCALAHCSTDLVFDGARPGGMYRETDATAPVNAYGRSKLEAEQRIGEVYPRAVICRLPLLIGLGAPGAPTFTDAWLEQMRRAEPLTLFTDEYRTPLAVDDAAAGLLLALDRATDIGAAGGIIHLAGPERINRYELGRHIRAAFARTLGVGDAPLVPGLQADVPMAAPRAADVSLDGSLARSLGFRPRTIREALERMASGPGA
ncbi:MAG: SDR family oxidoreductase [Phycisphaerales bacterium JB039]